MAEICRKIYPLSKKTVKLFLKEGSKVGDKKLLGAGAIFIGNMRHQNKKEQVAYLVLDYTKEAADLGGSHHPPHKNAMDTLLEEVYEESATTLKLSYNHDGRIRLNDKIDLTDRGFVLDTCPRHMDGVYRTFVFMLGDDYGPKNGFSPQAFQESHQRLVATPNISKSFLETSASYHIPVKSLCNPANDGTIRDITGQKMPLRGRTRRIFTLLCPLLKMKN